MRSLWTLSLLCCAFLAQAAGPRATFTENKGQWPAMVLYRVMLPNGALFVERSAFTYVLRSGGPAAHHGSEDHSHAEEPYRSHAFRVHFEGGEALGKSGGLKQAPYENYFLGNDAEHWGTGCAVFGEVRLKEVWPGIDLRLDGRDGLKYELLVKPGADPDQVRFRYEGQDGLELKDGRIEVHTTAGTVVEEEPFTFQPDANGQRTVPSRYKLTDDLLQFELPDGYDRTEPLTIDPTLAFASYSGSNSSNFGLTATYDIAGHLYGGGIVFGVNYPVTLGVLGDTFNSGTVDVGVSKWSADGSSLVWSTYYGGNGNESPHSMVVNENDELFILGSTGSTDLPTTAGCLDNSFGGGEALFFNGYGFDHLEGTDMFVAHFNAAATALIGSTYIGGAENDGINHEPSVAHNYGDTFRGEIIVDVAGNPVVASTTSSSNLPVVAGPQASYGGGAQDGYCFRLDPFLTTVLWSTYIGGSEVDAAYGVQLDSGGELFVTGGSTSSNLPMAPVGSQQTASGGTDGFIMRYSAAGALIGSTYLGTGQYDQCYFVQLNTSDEVFVIGQTHGPYPTTAGKYNVAGSSQFIHKFDHALSTSLWSMRFGNGDPFQDLSPTAFLVSDCGQIYVSGWGGSTNTIFGNPSSSTNGMEVTSDAFQPTTDGNDFYLMLLEPEAAGLNYATFFGGGLSPEHVDGGTSRFDKSGAVYQAVCAGCANNDDFPTTPGAWSNTNNSTGCNLGVLKFDLARGNAVIEIEGPSTLCLPATAQFINHSTGGNTYEWDFGNGSTSTLEEPTTNYDEVGTFTVTMILTDNTGCNGPDTTSIAIETLFPPVAELAPVDPLCAGLSVQLHATGGGDYMWFPSTGLDDPTIADPTLTPTEADTWSVVVSSFCGSDTAEVFIDPSEPAGTAGPDVELCLGESVYLSAEGGDHYAWTPVGTLVDPTSSSPLVTPVDTTTYTVVISTLAGCISTDSVVVSVVFGTPEPGLMDTLVCEHGSVRLMAPEAVDYLWHAQAGITDLTVPDPLVTPPSPSTYTVELRNICGITLDDAFVDVIVPQAFAWPDTIVCPGETVELFASAGSNHAWSPAQGLSDATGMSTTVTVSSSVLYTVVVTDEFGCEASDSVQVDAYETRPVDAGPDHIIDLGEVAFLSAIGEGSFLWVPPESLDRADTPTPVANPEESTTYTVTQTDEHGCKTTDVVMVILPGTLFIPNTFTPNGDGYNDFFGAWGKDLRSVELLVFNRWGELIWGTEQLSGRWDGTFKGVDSPIDTYVWKLKATEISGKNHQRVGHVNLLR